MEYDSLTEAWQDYESKVLPHATPDEIFYRKNAFYAGAICLLDIFLKKEEAKDILSIIHEIFVFRESILSDLDEDDT